MTSLPEDTPVPAEPTPKVPLVADILKGSAYALTIFTQAEVDALELFLKNGKPLEQP